MPDSTIRIVIADESPIYCLGIRALMAGEPGLNLVGEAQDGDRALALVEDQRPDILLLSLHLQGLNALEVLRRVAGTNPETRTVLLTTAIERGQMRVAVACGAWGVLLKDTATDVLTKCIRRVRRGEYWLGRNLVGDLVDAVRHPQKREETPFGLTGREREIVGQVVTGASNKDIARRLGLGEQTIKNQLRKIFAKLQVENRVELALMAVEQRLVDAVNPAPVLPLNASKPDTSAAH